MKLFSTVFVTVFHIVTLANRQKVINFARYKQVVDNSVKRLRFTDSLCS